jgi:hypothetical protein
VTINGWQVDHRLLKEFSLRRCGLGECRAWCCGMGVWVDLEHQQRVLAHADLVRPYLPPERHDERAWFDGEVVEDSDFPSGRCTGTSVVARPDHPLGTACTFLREDYRCALQMAGAENGLGRWGLKPFFCALHPLTFEDGRRVTLDDDNELYIGGGSCQRVQVDWRPLPLYQVMEDELRLVLGDDGYAELAAAAARRAAPAAQ